MEPVIRVKNLSKKFTYFSDRPTSLKTYLVNLLSGKFEFGSKETFGVLDDVSFDIFAGEFVGIMGRNGAGKSTILKIICGIYSPTSGSITVSGPIAPLIELGAGFNGDLSGYENVFLNASILGFGRKVSMEALPKILEFAELGEMIHMPVKNYSSGMLVRLGFAIATHLTAPILLVDEFLAVGDVGFQAKCLKKIEELHKSGRTIVFVTHDPGAVKTHCTRCIVIDHQKKVFDGSPQIGADIYVGAVTSPRSD